MPVVGGGSISVDLLPVAPTASDSAATFPTTAALFFSALWTMVDEVNLISSGFATPLSVLPVPPSGLDASFATHADAHLAAFPDLVSDVNGMITELSLGCGSITALPTVPSRGSDPSGFPTTAAVFLAALPTFRTQLNAFIAAFNGIVVGQLLLSGDMQSGSTDSILLSGDMQSGSDNLELSGSY